MLNLERTAMYARQRGVTFTQEDADEGPRLLEDDFQACLTGPQRRRVRHKAGSARTHGHEPGLRCAICAPAKRDRPSGWREPDQAMKF